MATLLEKNICVRGHDVSDKENSLYRYQRGKRNYTACRECVAENAARNRARSKGIDVPLRKQSRAYAVYPEMGIDERNLMSVILTRLRGNTELQEKVLVFMLENK